MATVEFSIPMDQDIKTRLDREAELEDRSAGYLAQKAIDAFLRQKEHLRKVVQDAEAEAEQGEFISGDAMHAWVDSWDSEDELTPPVPDIFVTKSATK